MIGPPSLCFALDVLYTEKILVPNLGELSRILLIHGIYRRVWEATRYHGDRLSDWVPSALSEPNHRSTSELLPRVYSVVSRWVNGSCDCLDVLHWSARSTILQASGFEHPTILHLHFSRLILLAPVCELQEYAREKLQRQTRNNSDPYLYSPMQDTTCPRSLLEWTVQNPSKARLAIIHAGSVFWYLRRYSCGAVIEPFAGYLATLVLWMFNVSTLAAELIGKSQPAHAPYESQGVDVRSPETSETSGASPTLTMLPPQTGLGDRGNPGYYDPSLPFRRITGGLEQFESHGTSIIQLDRPCDDELVQLYVRFGDQMTPYMAQIGDIKCKDAASKIIRQGIKLLCSHNDITTDTQRGSGERSHNFIWGAAENYISTLSALAASSQPIAG